MIKVIVTLNDGVPGGCDIEHVIVRCVNIDSTQGKCIFLQTLEMSIVKYIDISNAHQLFT